MGVQKPLGARNAFPSAERASAMQVVVGKAAADQRRNGDLGQRGHQGAPPVVAQRAAASLGGDAVPLPDATQPEAPEPDEAVLADAARAYQVPVRVGEALPRTDGLEARRMQR